MKKKLIYIVSNINKSLHFEWISPKLSEKYILKYILIGSRHSELSLFLKQNYIPYVEIPFQRKIDIISAWFKIRKILLLENPTIIHTHLWIANLIGLSVAWWLHIEVRVFTRHHATIHYNEYRSGLKWDRACNWLATDIVAISESIKNILENFDKAQVSKIRIINHGFDLPYFMDVGNERVEILRKKCGLKNGVSPVIGVIARYTKWKGIQFTIAAFKELRVSFPNAHLILANAQGDYTTTIKRMLQELPKESFTEIVFEEDLGALYKLFNVYVHVPTDEYAEAFGQTYVEALAAGIPSIFTLSGVAKEFVVHEKNALVVDYNNSEQIHRAIQKILSDESLTCSLIEQGKSSVSKFSLQVMLTKLESLYA